MKFSDVKVGQRFAYTFNKIEKGDGYHWEYIKVDEENERCVKMPEGRRNDYRSFGLGNQDFDVVVLENEKEDNKLTEIHHVLSLMENAQKAKKIFTDEVERLFAQGRISENQKEMLNNIV